MPIEFAPYTNDSKRLAAWREHYRAKGCSERKAEQCASRKRGGSTWPMTEGRGDG